MSVGIGHIAVSGLSKVCFNMKLIDGHRYVKLVH